MIKILFFVVLFLMSCSDLKREEQLVKLNTLQTELIESQNEFQNVYIDSLHVITMASSDLERKLKQNYKSDTIDVALGKRIDDYKRMRRMFGPLGSFGSKLKRAYKEQEGQLKTLQTDIENGFGERNKYDQYLELEKEKNKQVFDLLQEYLRIKKEAFEIYDLQHPWLSDFVVQLTSNND
tara:strand:- start:9000 stop:9539 length:540 start_codon:yes stop_codon:yes gene_type:complete